MKEPDRFEVYLARLCPADVGYGGADSRRRLCVIISPRSMNSGQPIVLIAPMAGVGFHHHPSNPCVYFKRDAHFVMMEQICTINKNRLIKRLGKLSRADARHILQTLNRILSRSPIA